jgi:hypothetical protein
LTEIAGEQLNPVDNRHDKIAMSASGHAAYSNRLPGSAERFGHQCPGAGHLNRKKDGFATPESALFRISPDSRASRATIRRPSIHPANAI